MEFQYVIGFALVCFVFSYGLQRRTVWMWYVGWLMLYLLAGYRGFFFFTALYYADHLDLGASTYIYQLGGFLLWLPAAIWWANHRHLFGRQGKPRPPGSASGPAPKSPDAQP